MPRPALRVDVSVKDRNELRQPLAGGIQQVHVVLRATALLQLALGKTANQIARFIPLTAQAIRNLGRRYQ